MTRWIVAGMTIVALSLGGVALATKEIGKDVGVTGCAKCHEGKPANKVFKPKVKEHIDKCKSKGSCKSCHEGNPKGKSSC